MYLLSIQPADTSIPTMSQVTLPEDTDISTGPSQTLLSWTPRVCRRAGKALLAPCITHVSPSRWEKPMAKVGAVPQ